MTANDYSTRTAVLLDTVHEHDHEHDHDHHHHDTNHHHHHLPHHHRHHVQPTVSFVVFSEDKK